MLLNLNTVWIILRSDGEWPHFFHRHKRGDGVDDDELAVDPKVIREGGWGGANAVRGEKEREGGREGERMCMHEKVGYQKIREGGTDGWLDPSSRLI